MIVFLMFMLFVLLVVVFQQRVHDFAKQIPRHTAFRYLPDDLFDLNDFRKHRAPTPHNV